MTRDWNFTLTSSTATTGTLIYTNLWTLITSDSSFKDPYFGNAPFVPNLVTMLKYQNQTPGANIYIADNKLKGGFQLTGGSWDVRNATTDSIDLTNVNFASDTNGAVLYVEITAY